jgi:hypothetical protein
MGKGGYGAPKKKKSRKRITIALPNAIAINLNKSSSQKIDYLYASVRLEHASHAHEIASVFCLTRKARVQAFSKAQNRKHDNNSAH